ncbi:MAG: RNA polymerase sigma factor [Candidatus Omnitrophota bacterium]
MQDISKELIIEAAEGDMESFEAIYRATSAFVYNVAYRVSNNAQDAEEVTQEVFLKVHKQMKYFRMQSSFKTWVYRITVNCAINHSKKMSKEKDRREKYQKCLNPWDMVSEPKANGIDHKEAAHLFLQILNPDQRVCVILRNLEGLSYQQIADTLKISINTVRSRLNRAREKLINTRKEVIKDEL